MKGQYQSPPVDDRIIWDVWHSFQNLPAMQAGLDIGLFDALVEGPLELVDLAARCKVNARALGVMASLLCALGLLVRRDGRFGLTAASRTYLVSSSEYYWGVLLSGYRSATPTTAKLLEALALDATHDGGENAKGWQAGEISQDAAHHIAAFMHAHSAAPAIAVARQPVFADVKRFLDVGAGSGVFTVAVAQRWPHLRGTVLDLGTMCVAAQKYIDDGEVGGQVDTCAVDFFRDPWPTGYDALFFSNVFHDWNDATCLDLARKAYDVLPSGGRIMLHEILVNDNLDGPATATSFSLMMLYGTQGKQYSLPEFGSILGEAGFVDCEATATCGYYSLVIARKP